MKHISIEAFDPLVSSSTEVRNITNKVESYSHEILAMGGYDNASITINDNQEGVVGWLRQGLGRHIEIRDDSLQIIFEGFVNKIVAALGPLQFTIGPLLDIGNKVAVSYTPTDTATNPPTTGTETLTAFTDDTDSQLLYGIIEKILSGNSAKDSTEASDVLTKFLNDPAGPYPATSRDDNLQGSSGPNVQLEIKGYWHWLTTYYYTDTNTGDRARSTKITDLLAAEPNGIFSTNYSQITSNTDTIKRQDLGRETAQTIMLNVNKTGISNSRSTMGFYAGRVFNYSSVPTTYEYIQRLSDNKGVVDIGEITLKPWNVLPARWIFYADMFLDGAIPNSLEQLQRDLRSGFIESVRYDAPYGLSVNGVKLDDLGLFLEKLNLKNGGT